MHSLTLSGVCKTVSRGYSATSWYECPNSLDEIEIWQYNGSGDAIHCTRNAVMECQWQVRLLTLSLPEGRS